ncbi:hypothetical protein MOQ_004939 [Trypanosoma cruzi marinkellei]|uniref:Uncharacterized protein n=1 Tax=Trypanosoma cruzi marinkellei TaxID=85056 RepID=K2NQQ2_TRYCR|nr:hypothetical protein MOQ_004939 [Trypanosoma cruzi marinkellei]
MEAGTDHDVIAAAKQKLNVLGCLTKAMDAEWQRKEALLQQLQTQLDEKEREKESVWHRARNISADTMATLNELRAIEELDMLDSMLVEKNTQLRLQQQRYDMLLQQLSNMEAVLDGMGSNEDFDFKTWASCCERMHRYIDATDRYCTRHTCHVVIHPVSVIHQSIRKMSRTARERDERLVIQLECLEKQMQRASSLDSTLQSNEAKYRCKWEELRRSNRERMQKIKEAGEVETMELRESLQEVKKEHNNLLCRLKDEVVAPVEVDLLSPPPVLENAHDISASMHEPRGVGPVKTTDVNCEFIANSSLRSVPILRRSRLTGRGRLTGASATTTATSDRDNDDDDDDTNETGNDGVAVRVTDAPVHVVPFSQSVMGLSFHHAASSAAPGVMNSEVEELRCQVIAAERDVDRLQQRYETLKEEAERTLLECVKKEKALEEKLCKSREAVSVLEKEKSGWQALHEQMSLLIS